MASHLPVVARGAGPTILFVHGSATGHLAWTLQLGTLAADHRVVTYDRRGVAGTPRLAGQRPSTAADADDAADVLEGVAADRALVVGSSYGAVVALELARRHPARVAGLVLCEPPLAPGDAPRAEVGLGCACDALAARVGGAAAAEVFLRTVLGDAAFAGGPSHVFAGALTTWPQIRGDAVALASWSMPRGALASIAVPTLLLGGDRSLPRFADALDVLELALPAARRLTLARAGHAMQLDQPRAFDRAVREHAARCFRPP